MRRVRLSLTFIDELERLLAQGRSKFGDRVVAQSRDNVRAKIEKHLAYFPERPVDDVLGICAVSLRKPPFVLLYDHDDAELRVHLVIHESADRTTVDLSTVVW